MTGKKRMIMSFISACKSDWEFCWCVLNGKIEIEFGTQNQSDAMVFKRTSFHIFLIFKCSHAPDIVMRAHEECDHHFEIQWSHVWHWRNKAFENTVVLLNRLAVDNDIVNFIGTGMLNCYYSCCDTIWYNLWYSLKSPLPLTLVNNTFFKSLTHVLK